MQEITNFYLTFPIQPLFLRFIIYVLLYSLAIDFFAGLLFNEEINELAVSLNVLAGSGAALVCESFGRRRFASIAKEKPNLSTQWLRLLKSVRAKVLPTKKNTLDIFEAFARESLRQRARTTCLGPLLFVCLALANYFIAVRLNQFNLLVPAGLFLAVALSFFVDSFQRSRRISYLLQIYKVKVDE